MAFSSTYRGEDHINNTNSTTHTFASKAIGTAAATRYVFVLFSAFNNAARTLNSITIGGVTATIETLVGSLTAAEGLVGIAFANVPTGTTANIVFTWSGTFIQDISHGVGIDWYTVDGATNLNVTAVDSLSVNAAAEVSKTFSAPNNSVAFVIGNLTGQGTPTRAVGSFFSTDDAYTQYVSGRWRYAGKYVNTTGSATSPVFQSVGWNANNGGSAGLPTIGKVYADTSPPVAAIATVLPAFTQDLVAQAPPTANVATIFPAITQALVSSVAPRAAIDMTLPKMTQALAARVPVFSVDVTERNHRGQGFGTVTADVSASAAGKLIVLVLGFESTANVAPAISAIDTIAGQPAWTKRSQKLGTSTSTAFGLEVWYLVSNSAFATTTVNVTYSGGGGNNGWENICLEYNNVDPVTPWDTNVSLPSSTENASLSTGVVPSISGRSTTQAKTLLVGYYGSNGPSIQGAATGYTLDAEEIQSGGSASSPNVAEQSQSVTSAQSNVTMAMTGATTGWCFIVDAIRGLTVTATVDQTLRAFTQRIDVAEGVVITTAIDQTLPGFTQADTIIEIEPSTIAQTLLGFTQEIDVTAAYNGIVNQTLPGFTQEIDAANTLPPASATIDTLLRGFTQEIDTVEVPNAIVDQTLSGIVQRADVAEVLSSTVDQTLNGFTQALSVGFGDAAAHVDMVICAPVPPPDVTVTELAHRESISFGAPSVEVSATDAGKLIVVQAVSVCTGSVGNTVDFLTSIEGQPPWQRRAAIHGNQSGCGVSLETWYFISNSAFDPVTVGVHYLGGSTTMAWEVLCLEYGNVDPVTPWDDDPSVPATQQNNSLIFTTAPNIGGLTTAHDYCLQVGYFGSNQAVEPAAGTGYTRNATEDIVAASHTSATAIAESKVVRTRSSGLSASMSDGASSWCFIADTIRGTNTPRTAMTQALDATSNPGVKAFNQTLFGISQEIDVMANPGAHIDTTLPKMVQRADVDVSPVVSLAQTFKPIIIGGNFVVNNPDGSIFGQANQTLPRFVQEVDGTVSANGDITQTLHGFVQEIDVNHAVPNVTSDIAAELMGFSQSVSVSLTPAAEIVTSLRPMTMDFPLHVIVDNPTGTGLCVIDQTFPGLTQMEVVVVSTGALGIDTVLPGFTQRADVVLNDVTFIDTTLFMLVKSKQDEIVGDVAQTLPGFSEEIDAAEDMDGAIHQTLAGFGQEIDISVHNSTAVVTGHSDQTLHGFGQEIDVFLPITGDAAVELHGFTQRATMHVARRHARKPHAITMPSKDMPIHKGELEFFRGKVYGRSVDAMVPPLFVAEHNLTTKHHAKFRPPTVPAPRGKPK